MLCDSDWFLLPKLKTVLLSPLPDKRVGLASGYISIPIFYNSHSNFCRASIRTFLWVNENPEMTSLGTLNKLPSLGIVSALSTMETRWPHVHCLD